jgi:hypothetical protein
MNKPDVILITAYGVATFRGPDVEQAIDASNFETCPIPGVTFDKLTRFYVNLGYEHYRLPGEAYDARICVQRGFDVDTAKTIAKRYLAMVREALA